MIIFFYEQHGFLIRLDFQFQLLMLYPGNAVMISFQIY